MAGNTQTGSSLLVIDKESTASPLVWGDFNANIFKINGSIQYTGTCTQASDMRLKKNIQPIENALAGIALLRGVYFNWNKEEDSTLVVNETRQIGVVAQEVEQVFPELVITNEKGYKMVDYTKLAPILIEAVKDQQIQINNLKDENAALREKTIKDISNLKAELDQIKALLSKGESIE